MTENYDGTPAPAEAAASEETPALVVLEVDVEELARELHEAGRDAVEAGATVAAEHLGERAEVESPRKFIEWDDLTENAKDGRRSQARNLLAKFAIFPRHEKGRLIS